MRYLYQNTELTIKHIKLIHAYRKVSDQTIDILLGLVRLFNDPEEILSKPAFAVISAGLTERAASHGCSKGRATCEARVPRFRLAKGFENHSTKFFLLQFGEEFVLSLGMCVFAVYIGRQAFHFTCRGSRHTQTFGVDSVTTVFWPAQIGAPR